MGAWASALRRAALSASAAEESVESVVVQSAGGADLDADVAGLDRDLVARRCGRSCRDSFVLGNPVEHRAGEAVRYCTTGHAPASAAGTVLGEEILEQFARGREGQRLAFIGPILEDHEPAGIGAARLQRRKAR